MSELCSKTQHTKPGSGQSVRVALAGPSCAKPQARWPSSVAPAGPEGQTSEEGQFLRSIGRTHVPRRNFAVTATGTLGSAAPRNNDQALIQAVVYSKILPMSEHQGGAAVLPAAYSMFLMTLIRRGLGSEQRQKNRDLCNQAV